MTASRASARSRWPACTAPTRLARRCARSTASTPPPTRWCCTPRTSASVAAIASTPAHSARRNIPGSATSARAARWTNALIARAGRKPTARWPSSRSTAPIVWRKANCRSARRCVRPSRCWPATARSSRRFTRSGSSSAAMARAPGAGKRPIARRSHHRNVGARCAPSPGHGCWVPEANAMNIGLSAVAEVAEDDGQQGGNTMAMLISRIRFIVGALALALIVVVAAPAGAQQRNPDSSVNPTASSVKEDQLFNEFNRISGRCTIPDQKACTIEQPAGRDWRHFHEVTLRWIGAISILGMLALLVFFYLTRGMVRIESGRSGRVLVRFSAFERFVHWMTATCFIILALTGLNITFGKPLLLPLIGAEAFTNLSQWAKYAHNYLSFPFTLGVFVIFLMWIAWNIPNRVDVEWLNEGGGMVGHKHPPAYRFNAGQKMIYWIVVLGGGAAAASGYFLMFPFYGTNIADMQIAQIVHGVVALLFVAVMIAHIYIGTIGMEGAFEAMGTGDVDVNWAKEHHSLWLEQEQARTNAPQPRPAATPAE